MTEQQKRATAALSMLIVVAAMLLLGWLVLAIEISHASLGDRAPGRQFMLIVANWEVLGIALKALPALITIGIGLAASYKLKDWQFYGLVSASISGVVVSVYLVIEVSSADTARRFWAYSPLNRLQDYDSFVSAAQAGLVVIAAWLLAVLGIQLRAKGSG